MTQMLELFLHLQNQFMATFGAKEKDGSSMLSSPEREMEVSKEVEGGLERAKEGLRTRIPLVVEVWILGHSMDWK